MKKIYLVFITLLGLTINANSQSGFIKETHHFEIDTILRVAVLFDREYYCLREDHQLFTLTPKTGVIDTSLNPGTMSLKLQDLYVHHDTLFALSRFNIYYLTKKRAWEFLSQIQRKINYLYEDERFSVISTCSGEWGGSLYFTDKKTKQKYECQCTCAVNVQKENNTYLIAASLSHLSGFANIFKIADPLKLKKYDRRNLKGKKVIYVGENESKSTQGTEQLVDSFGTTIAATINYNGKNYYLINKYKHVSIDTVGNKKLNPVEDLTTMDIYAYNSSEIRNSYEHQIATFANSKKTGFIDINKNKLSFYIFDIKHK